MVQAKNSVRINNGFKWFLGIMAVLFVLFSFGAYIKLNDMGGKLQAEYESELNKALSEQASEFQAKLDSKDATINELTTKLAEATTKQSTEGTDESSIVGYLLDKIFLSTSIDDEFSDREIKTLFDGKVDFDGDRYDAEESLILSGLEVLANEDDFKGVPYLTIPFEGIEYKMVFDSDLDTSLIDDEETLVFTLLGKEVEVSEWDGDKVTFTQGEESLMSEGEVKVVGDKEFKLLHVMENSIFISVNGDTKEIEEGETKKVNGLEIEVKNVIYSEVGPVLKAIVVLGDEVEKTVENGDEYEEDSIWEWKISANSIGIVLNEEFMELDDEYKPLAASEKLCLPNDYVCVRYDGVLEEDSEDYSFELDTRNGVDYVEARGLFLSGINDYEKVYINDTGIYDKDFELIGTEAELGDSDLSLKLVSGNIRIDNIEFPMDLTSIKVSGTDISSNEDDYLTDYGVLIKNPEDSVDDQEINIVVPEEKVESTITLI